MFAVVRIRGSVDVRRETKDTFSMLHLRAPNNCIVCPETKDWKGMIEKIKDWVTYGEIDKQTLAALLQKRLHGPNDKKVDVKMLKELTASKYDSFEKFADDLIANKVKMKNFEKIKLFFRLTPPSKGLKSVKEHYPRGDLGYRGKEINKLLERMM